MEKKEHQTELQLEIYEKLRLVPKGKVITYKELAKSVNSNASRFVGRCMKNNLDPVSIPCYKVVLTNGEVWNYSSKGGTKSKIRKLENDGVEIINGNVDLEKFGFKFKN